MGLDKNELQYDLSDLDSFVFNFETAVMGNDSKNQELSELYSIKVYLESGLYTDEEAKAEWSNIVKDKDSIDEAIKSIMGTASREAIESVRNTVNTWKEGEKKVVEELANVKENAATNVSTVNSLFGKKPKRTIIFFILFS